MPSDDEIPPAAVDLMAALKASLARAEEAREARIADREYDQTGEMWTDTVERDADLPDAD